MSAEILFGIPNKKSKRHRVTKTGLVDRRAALLEIVRAAQPATVRQIFYLASVRGIVAKDEGGYSRVQIDLVDPNKLRELVEEVVVRHLPPDQYEVLIAAEKSERTLFQGLAGLVKQLRNGKTDDLSGGAS